MLLPRQDTLTSASSWRAKGAAEGEEEMGRKWSKVRGGEMGVRCAV